jgi:hypothetical protein
MTSLKRLSSLALALALTFVTVGCGMKTDLVTPGGKETPHDQKDKNPSRPTSPIGQ